MNDQRQNQTESGLEQRPQDAVTRPPVRRVVSAALSITVAPEGHEEEHYVEGRPPLMTDEIRRRLPRLHATENDEDPVVQGRFRAWNVCDWNVVEFDGENICFGLIWQWYPIWGYFALSHLETINVRHGGPAIVVDRFFQPRRVSHAMLDYTYYC